jgi:1,2-phenylacetyl-CoA epoxidase PaaB subunit
MEVIYEVLARVKRDLPLQIVGTVTAPTAKLAAVYAYKTYDEFNYIDMKIVPRKEIVEVFSISPMKRKEGTA